jgi:hypothetical protein
MRRFRGILCVLASIWLTGCDGGARPTDPVPRPEQADDELTTGWFTLWEWPYGAIKANIVDEYNPCADEGVAAYRLEVMSAGYGDAAWWGDYCVDAVMTSYDLVTQQVRQYAQDRCKRTGGPLKLLGGAQYPPDNSQCYTLADGRTAHYYIMTYTCGCGGAAAP